MTYAKFFFAALLCITLIEKSHGANLKYKSQKTPTFNKFYSVGGIINLPYAEINEPFYAWYDEDNIRSRVDFYGGMVKTYQLPSVGQFGSGYKIAPMTNEKVTNAMTCFQINGTSASSVSIQTVLPDLSNFVWSGTDVIEGRAVDVWQNETILFGRSNKYTMWLEQGSGVPVKYDMIGYDSLLGSHYDRYYVTYYDYNSNDRPDSSIFVIPEDVTCGGFPGPGATDLLSANPMSEWFPKSASEPHQSRERSFDTFQRVHGWRYSNHKEARYRQHVFRHNVRFIESTNRRGLSFSVGVNHLADKTSAELRKLRGRKSSPLPHGNGAGSVFPSMKELKLKKSIPDSIDWRLTGAVSPVKDQAICGSCWSFGTTGVLEGAYFLRHGVRVRLSQQQLMDCSWGFGNNACDGGEDFRAYSYLMQHGLSTEDDYGSYLGQDGYCHAANVTSVLKVADYVNVTAGSTDALLLALATKGPISVSIDASQLSFSFYSYGVYYDPQCRNDPDGLDHSVLAVGYGTMNGQAYWLVKNSWSFYWGNNGYVLMSQKDNNCGVATAATFPILK